MKTTPMKSDKTTDKKLAIRRTSMKIPAKREKYVPTKEEIDELAEIFFNQRIEHGEYGTAENEWYRQDDRFRAEEYYRRRGTLKKSA